MKTTKSIFTIVLAALILLGSATAPSQVPEGWTTVPDEHNNAVYMVFQSNPPPERRYAIFFIQTQGKYELEPFLCTDGVWQPGSQSVSCFVVHEPPRYPVYVKETVTVGKLTGHFCTDLQGKYNPSEGEDFSGPIMQDVDCHAPGKCSCYEVVHECREDQGGVWEICDIASLPTDPTRDRNECSPGAGCVPPSRGAGSGSN
jgi:hypothetical protein